MKLRGYRIETGEVEEAALSCEAVQYAAASVREINGSPHLVLYYTLKEGCVLTEQELKKFVGRTELPDYMQPEIYVRLSEMPRLPNGKTDSRSLPLPEADLSVENVAPDTAMEAHFLKAAKEILPNTGFGVTDDLFSLGLTSLSAMKLIVRLNAMDYPQKYRVADLMRYKNIRDMIKGNRRIFWQYGEAAPDRPCLILINGIAPVAGTLSMLDKWKNDYNIFVIEAIDAHYDILFDSTSKFADVVDTYALMLEQRLPGDAKVAGMVGFSWGGAALAACAVMIFSLRKHKLLRLCVPSRKYGVSMTTMLTAGVAGARLFPHGRAGVGLSDNDSPSMLVGVRCCRAAGYDMVGFAVFRRADDNHCSCGFVGMPQGEEKRV